MYRFYSSPTSGLRITVVGHYDEEQKELKVAVARCSRKDTFVRKIGRAIAEGRLKKDNLYDTYSYPERISTKDFNELATRISEAVEKDASLVH